MPIIRSISVKLIVTTVIVMALTLTLGFAVFLRMEREHFSETMMQETGQISKTVLASLDRSMMENDPRRTIELMQTLANADGVSHLMIVNPKGVVALSPRLEDKGTLLLSKGGTCELCHQGKRVKERAVLAHRRPDREEVFRHLTPILNRAECRSCHQGRFLGLLITDVSTTGLRLHEASQIRRFALIALSIFCVLTLSILVVVTVLVRRPIGVLIRGTREMARGNYDFRIPKFARDELGDLAQGFNEMAEKVNRSRSLLERWNVSLEEEVDRRTEELRRSNLQLEEEKNKTESVVHSVAEGVLSIDREGVVVLANPAAAEIFGREEIVLRGLRLREMLKFLSGRFRNQDEIEEFMLAADPAEGEQAVVVQQIQPHPRTYKMSRNRICGPRGEGRGWVFSFHDITKEKEIDEIKTNLVAMVSHELRTPLTAIKGALSLITEGGLSTEAERREFQHIALSNTDRLIELINNLLDMSKIESRSIFYEYGSFYVKPLLERCIDAVASFTLRNQVTIRLEAKEEMGEVAGDAVKIEQVVINLLSNAIKFSSAGGEVRVAARVADGNLIVSVTDEGIGIPAHEQEKIFEKFYQVDMSTVRRVGGSGLGLSICKAIIEGHGGRIWVDSRLGEGSTFSFSMPIAQPARTEQAELPLRPVVAGHEKIPCRVLVVEDETSVRKILTRYLEEKGFEVLQASCAKEALELARLSRPDCITVDVMLPDLDGFDLTAVLKSDPKTNQIPIIFISVVEGEGKLRGFNLGAAAYFTKPVHYEQVVEKIEGLIGTLDLPQERPSILLVDDEPDIVRSMGAYLEHRGYHVRYAYSGQEALDAFHQSVPNLLVLDLLMPGMSGFELIRKLKEAPRFSRVPIIVVTASEAGRSRAEVLDLGANAFFRKPVYPEQLWREIEKIIN